MPVAPVEQGLAQASIACTLPALLYGSAEPHPGVQAWDPGALLTVSSMTLDAMWHTDVA
jgi:hypothetical protein